MHHEPCFLDALSLLLVLLLNLVEVLFAALRQVEQLCLELEGLVNILAFEHLLEVLTLVDYIVD